MPITKRKLMAWRTEALKQLQRSQTQNPTRMTPLNPLTIANERILKLTQTLIDQHLLTEGSKE